jgi:hypothetical protein
MIFLLLIARSLPSSRTSKRFRKSAQGCSRTKRSAGNYLGLVVKSLPTSKRLRQGPPIGWPWKNGTNPLRFEPHAHNSFRADNRRRRQLEISIEQFLLSSFYWSLKKRRGALPRSQQTSFFPAICSSSPMQNRNCSIETAQ